MDAIVNLLAFWGFISIFIAIGQNKSLEEKESDIQFLYAILNLI